MIPWHDEADKLGLYWNEVQLLARSAGIKATARNGDATIAGKIFHRHGKWYDGKAIERWISASRARAR